eukprot:Gb_10182 [translate_table: standard]
MRGTISRCTRPLSCHHCHYRILESRRGSCLCIALILRVVLIRHLHVHMELHAILTTAHFPASKVPAAHLGQSDCIKTATVQSDWIADITRFQFLLAIHLYQTLLGSRIGEPQIVPNEEGSGRRPSCEVR